MLVAPFEFRVEVFGEGGFYAGVEEGEVDGFYAVDVAGEDVRAAREQFAEGGHRVVVRGYVHRRGHIQRPDIHADIAEIEGFLVVFEALVV